MKHETKNDKFITRDRIEGSTRIMQKVSLASGLEKIE